MDYELIRKIRENTDIVDLIGKYIPLVKKGKNYFGLCPFHSDTNPSLSVSREKQIYKCFVCGEAGNVFNFLMKYENISFKESVRLVGNEIGVSIFEDFKRVDDKNKVYYDIYDIANKFYQNNLLSKEGEKAREYLKTRNLDMDTIKEFQIGLSLKNRDTLTNLLVKKGYDINTLNNLGLATDDYDTYINRIIFPLFNFNGLVNGFSGRIFNGENINKYLNSKETPIFKKGENLFNYHRAKESVRQDKFVIVMEGFMAVIRAYTIGVKNCIALMGTSLTNEQILSIKKLSNKVYLCLDGDKAGESATINNGKLLMDANLDVKVIPLSDNLDPDDYILKYGSDKFYSLISNAINYNDYKIKVLKKGIDFNSSNDLANYINLVLNEISLENDEIKREIMLKNLAKETNVWYNTLEKKLNELLSKKVSVSKTNFKEPLVKVKKFDKYEKTLQTIVYYMVSNREVITIVSNSHIHIPLDSYRILIREITYFYEKYGYINIADFLTYIEDNKELKDLFSEILKLDIEYSEDKKVILDYLKVIKDYNVALEIKRLENLIKNEIDPNEQAKISNQIMKLRIGSESND
ncbi:MAG: DNA primase [Bacilli bacterium]|nr:DNA primase [Bacilli bacterium]